MDKLKLNRTLKSIRKSCFIKYFDKFQNDLISNELLAELISKNENYKYSATKTRVNSARKILKNKFENDALKIIIESMKLDEHIRHNAYSHLVKN